MADEIQVNFEISKLAVGRNIRLVTSFNQGTASYSLTNAFQSVFSGKAYWKVVLWKYEKSGNHTISYQSLLLSTTVLNDSYMIRVNVYYNDQCL